MEEQQKRSQRLRTLKGDSILVANGGAIDCTVRNISETGARLEVENPVGIPDKFTLIAQHERIKRGCRIVWRKAKQIGVRFVDIVSVGSLVHIAANSLADAAVLLTGVCV